MVETVILYHNKHCSKSRAAIALLNEREVNVKVIDYLNAPLEFEELKSIFTKLGVSSARSMMRVKDELYRNLNLDSPDLDNDNLLQAVAAHPALLERPIIVAGSKAVVGRPLENIEQLLEESI